MAEANSSVSGRSALVPVLFALLLYVLDLTFGFGGINLSVVSSHFASFIAVSWRTIVSIVVGIVVFFWLMNFSRFNKQDAMLIAIASFLFITIFLFGGASTSILLHLIGIPIVIFLLKAPDLTLQTKMGFIIAFYIIDFFALGLISQIWRIKNVELFFHAIPIFQVVVMAKAIEYESSSALRFFYQILIGVVVLVAVFYGIPDLYTLNAAYTISPEKLQQDVLEFWKEAFQNMGNVGTDIIQGFKDLTNTSRIVPDYNGEPEESDNPQGLYLEELERGDIIYRPGIPVSVWAVVEARTLDDNRPIEVTVTCETEIETDDITFTQSGVINGGQFSVTSEDERSILCRFDNLPEGDYDITFRAEFNFQTKAEKRIYLMDQERIINDAKLLRDKGLTGTREEILREIYKIEDTDPKTIFTTGPISIGIGTNKVPWEISTYDTIRPYFGVTIENDWNVGGMIKRINNIVLKIPDSFSISPEDCDHIVESSGSEDDFSLYTVIPNEELIEDVEDFVTVNCIMSIDPIESLVSSQVTPELLKVHVEYDYVLEEEISIEVEGYDFDVDIEGVIASNKVCCKHQIKGTTTSPNYAWVNTKDECLDQQSINPEIMYSIEKDNSYCHEVCCKLVDINAGSSSASFEIGLSQKECELKTKYPIYTSALPTGKCP